MQFAGFQHSELMSNVPFLGEGVMELATREGDGIWGCESKDEIGKERTKLSNVLVFGFLRGTVGELPLPASACSNHCGKSLSLQAGVSQRSQHR